MKKFLSSKFQIPCLRRFARALHAGRSFGRQASSEKSGTTLLELMVVIAIIAVISLFGFLSLFGRKGATDLTNTTAQMASLLREARSRSVSQASSTSWGVHFDNATSSVPFFALFYGTYGVNTRIGYYRLPATLVYATSTIPSGSSINVTFSQISGLASASTSIGIILINGSLNSSTINVASSGAVSF
ncbi:MAG TPA: prepilin-type N-terminal cleavage/methylation domain-containing protein [Candidatus Paceibacterota bacterium]|nr:prepilin-type N-terminal cleavage/methylation domain-containing protein [Candidatus Paceibacterota bacterium]